MYTYTYINNKYILSGVIAEMKYAYDLRHSFNVKLLGETCIANFAKSSSCRPDFPGSGGVGQTGRPPSCRTGVNPSVTSRLF